MASEPKLSAAMLRALWAVSKSDRVSHVRLATLEALCRRGLVECHALYVTKGFYRDDTGDHRQRYWSGWWRFWYLRTAGYEAIGITEKDRPDAN